MLLVSDYDIVNTILIDFFIDEIIFERICKPEFGGMTAVLFSKACL